MQILHPDKVPEAHPYMALFRLHPFQRRAGAYVLKEHDHAVLIVAATVSDMTVAYLPSARTTEPWSWGWIGNSLWIVLSGTEEVRWLACAVKFEWARHKAESMYRSIVHENTDSIAQHHQASFELLYSGR